MHIINRYKPEVWLDHNEMYRVEIYETNSTDLLGRCLGWHLVATEPSLQLYFEIVVLHILSFDAKNQRLDLWSRASYGLNLHLVGNSLAPPTGQKCVFKIHFLMFHQIGDNERWWPWSAHYTMNWFGLTNEKKDNEAFWLALKILA